MFGGKQEYSFKNITSWETRLSNHQHMIVIMLKTSFQQRENTFFNSNHNKNFSSLKTRSLVVSDLRS